jgi:hypothetical protein
VFTSEFRKGAERRNKRPIASKPIMVLGLLAKGMKSAEPPLVITARAVAIDTLPIHAKNKSCHPPRPPLTFAKIILHISFNFGSVNLTVWCNYPRANTANAADYQENACDSNFEFWPQQ